MSAALEAWRNIAHRTNGPAVLTITREALRVLFVEMDERASRAEAEARLAQAQVLHYEGWFGTECHCDDEDCPL